MKKAITKTIFTLTILVGSLGFAKPPTNFSALVGVWNNTNPSTRGIVRVVVRKSGAGITVQPFGACSPTPCNHGIIRARSFSSGVGDAHAIGFNAVRNFGFKSTAYNAIWGGNTLALLTQDTFAPMDSRFNYTMMESFVRASTVAPDEDSESSSPVTDHGSSSDLE